MKVIQLNLSIAISVQNNSSGGLKSLFSGLLEDASFDDMQIGTLSAEFASDDQFEMQTKLEGRLELADGSILGVKGYQTLIWTNEGSWKLSAWKQKKLKAIVSKQVTIRKRHGFRQFLIR